MDNSGQMGTQNVSLATFKALASDKQFGSIRAVGVKGGFTVTISGQSKVWQLVNARGVPRTFASLNTLSEALMALGVTEFEVSASTYEKGRLRKARPDRSEALKKTRAQPSLELV